MKTYLEIADIELMEQASHCLRDRLLIRLLFRLGCRVSEALALRVSDVDFERATVRIVHLKTRIRLSCPNCKTALARKHQFCPGCGKEINKVTRGKLEYRRMRILPIDSNTLDMLKDYITDNEKIQSCHASHIFPLNRHRAWQVVRDCAKRANIPHLVNPETGRVRGVSPHRLRDAFAVHAMKFDDSADSLRLLQEHLGHASFNTTARYRKIAGEEHRMWYEKLWTENS